MRNPVHVISPRGPLATRRMTAHWMVLAAAALTTLVMAAAAAALAVFAGQALPLAVQHDLVAAPGTAMSVTGLLSDPGQARPDSAALRSKIAAALPGIPFSLRAAFWSGSLALVPGALPAPPASAGKGNTPLLQAYSMSEITSHAVLVTGRWPGAVAARGDPTGAIPAVLPAPAAALLHVRAGEVLRLRDGATNTLESFEVTGTFALRPGPGARSYWTLSDIPPSGIAAAGGSTTYGPLIVSQASFGPGFAMSGGSWVAQPDMAAFTGGALSRMSASVTALSRSLSRLSSPAGTQLTTSLPSVLAGAGSTLAVARSELVMSALELLLLTSVAMLAVARLLAAQREGETALLIARGATRSQLTRLTAAEVIPLSVVMSAAGGLAGIRLAGMLASAGSLGAASLRLSGHAGAYLDALAAAAVVAVAAIAALLAPVLTPGPGAARARRGRQAMVAGVTRAGLDVALVVLAVLAGWQLRQYSALGDNGAGGIDPVLALAPALALAAGSIAALRLLPLAALAADRLAARGRRLTVALAGWQLSRMPVRQGTAALLLIMAVAIGTLALAQHDSWDQSAADQAAFATGGDVQVNLPGPLPAGQTGDLTGATGVTGSMAVVSDLDASPGEVVALGSLQAAQVTRLRRDESPLPPARLFRAISPSGGLAGAVLAAPQPGARPGTIRLAAALGPAAPVPAGRLAALAAQLGPVTVTLTILDQAGSAYQVSAGTLVADERPHLLVASLGGARARYPLRVAAITAAFQMPARAGPALALTVTGLPLGGGWTGTGSSVALTTLQTTKGALPGPHALPGLKSARAGRQAVTFTFSPGYGRPLTGSRAQADASDQGAPAGPGPAPGRLSGQLALFPPAAPVAAVPAIATRAFLDSSYLRVGAVVPAFISGSTVPLRIVAEVPEFPTVTAAGGALITDLGSVQEYLTRRSQSPLPVTQWWLATSGAGVPAAVTASVPPGTAITSAAGVARATMSDPLSAAPQLILLAMAAATAVLAVTGFCVSIAADVRSRRAETALLAALGVTQRGAAVQLCLEKLLLSLPSAVIGLLLGTLVARLLVPAVTLTPAAQLPTPPAVTLYDLPQAALLALAVAVLPAVAAAVAAARRPDPAAELRSIQAG
jgi:FtsX-like permease family